LLLQTFIKVANYQHMMPTRYTLDVDLKGLITNEAVENSSKRTEARKVSAQTSGFVTLPAKYVTISMVWLTLGAMQICLL
jgi:hypothetical protein